MFYRFDEQSLRWKKDTKKTKWFFSSIIILMIGSFLLGRFQRFASLDHYEKELMVISLEAEKNKFSKEKMVEELKRLNVRFPHIVMAQSIIETGNFNSRIFRENHNLFGMKQATVRINTAVGTQHGHAYYETGMNLFTIMLFISVDIFLISETNRSIISIFQKFMLKLVTDMFER